MPNSIRKYRQTAHLTQQEFAQKLGISVDCIKRYENGRRQPRAETLKAMATLFGCSMEELLKSD